MHEAPDVCIVPKSLPKWMLFSKDHLASDNSEEVDRFNEAPLKILLKWGKKGFHANKKRLHENSIKIGAWVPSCPQETQCSMKEKKGLSYWIKLQDIHIGKVGTRWKQFDHFWIMQSLAFTFPPKWSKVNACWPLHHLSSNGIWIASTGFTQCGFMFQRQGGFNFKF